jgi:hypothetical protein
MCSFVKLHRTSDILLQKFYAFLMPIVFSEPQQPNCGLDRLIMEICRPLTDTHIR